MTAARCRGLLCAVVAVSLTACADEPTSLPSELRPNFSVGADGLELLGDPSGGTAALLASLNQRLAAAGAPYAVRSAAFVLAAHADPNRATIVVANDRTHRLDYQFVPGDPRRATVGPIVRQASFLPLSNAPTGPGTSVNAKPSVDAAFTTWSNVKCSKLDIENNILPPNVFPSAILSLGGFISNPLLSDVNTVGFLPGAIFNAVLGPGAANQVLGVTFPFIFVDAAGNATDLDRDGNDDLAFAEIWYNAAFAWTNTGTGNNVDIESVALHENGHALGLGHFGKITFNPANGRVKAAPRAVMNAIILDTQRKPLGTDNGGYCGFWAKWPH